MTEKNKRYLRYIRQNQITDALKKFEGRNAITQGEFSIKVPSLLIDMEWNQMDQLHRPFIHKTYQKNIRIALGNDFAVSLTKWGRWPFLITVTDIRVDRGVYYSDFVLAGVLYVHNIIKFTEADEIVELRHEWTISSHKLFKPLHWMLSKMWFNLDVRLQKEDADIRSQRYKLRKLGYRFASDSDNPDFYTSNLLTNNTVYPDIPQDSTIDLNGIPENSLIAQPVGKTEFLIKKMPDHVLVWPSACPHEGGELAKGTLHQDCRLECPWHGLKFDAAILSKDKASIEAYGFLYTYMPHKNKIYVKNLKHTDCTR